MLKRQTTCCLQASKKFLPGAQGESLPKTTLEAGSCSRVGETKVS